MTRAGEGVLTELTKDSQTGKKYPLPAGGESTWPSEGPGTEWTI